MEITITFEETLLINASLYSIFCLIVHIVVHIGVLEHGHYVAYVKTDGGWMRADDATLTQQNEPLILGPEETAYLFALCKKPDLPPKLQPKLLPDLGPELQPELQPESDETNQDLLEPIHSLSLIMRLSDSEWIGSNKS